MADIIVIGGGTAGLTAALYARRAGKTVTLIEKESTGGKIVFAPRIENYPGLPSVSGADYAAALTDQAEKAGVCIQYDEVSAIEPDGKGFAVRCDSGTERCRALILAVGTANRKLGLGNEESLVGCGVSYCAVCDGAFYSGAETAVVGGGNTALTDALFLSGICKKVTLVHRRDSFRAEQVLVDQLRAKPNVSFLLCKTVSSLHANDGELKGITVRDLKTGVEESFPLDGLFVAIGQTPQTDICRSLVDLDAAGYIRASEDCVTSRPGIFAAGDCRTKSVRQLTTAAADGAVAALAACRYADEV